MTRLKHTGTFMLGKLAEFLRQMPGRHITIAGKRLKFEPDRSCGVFIGDTLKPRVGLVGFAAAHPYFQREGLNLYRTSSAHTMLSPIYTGDDVEFGLIDWEAIAHFFALTQDEAIYLFSDYEYSAELPKTPTPKEVAKRIEAFVAKRTAELEAEKPAARRKSTVVIDLGAGRKRASKR